MTGIGSLIKDGIGQAANAMYETVLSPMLTWLGGIMFAQGRALLNCGFSIWKSCTQVALNFVQKNPDGQFGAWSIVSGSGVYGVFLAIAGSLTIFYFVAGWLKESIDIRSTFNLESMFKMFIRFAITISLVMNSMSLVRGINNASLALAHTIQITESDEKKQTVDQVFDSMEESLKSTGESEGSSWFSAGLIALIGGLVGMFTILVSGVELAITVIKRLFKVYMCIPFAPVALAGCPGSARGFCRRARILTDRDRMAEDIYSILPGSICDCIVDQAEFRPVCLSCAELHDRQCRYHGADDACDLQPVYADGRYGCLRERSRWSSTVLHGTGLITMLTKPFKNHTLELEKEVIYMSTSLVQMRMDTQLRDDANSLFDSLGLDMSTAVKIFLKKCLAEGGIPFEVKNDRSRYSSPEGLRAFMELRRQAESDGLTGMSLDEINAEIAAARAEKGAKNA